MTAPTTAPGTSAPPPKPKRSAFAFFIWWKPDPAEIAKQVAGYDTLKVWQSARGISMLLCFFTVTVTGLLGRVLNLSSGAIAFEVVMWGTLGVLMFRGVQLAFWAGMILWSIEKISLMFSQLSAARTPIVQIIWWCIYMSAFFLALKVEQQRSKAPAA